MREDRIKNAFEYIQTSEKTDEKVLSIVINRQQKGNPRNWSKVAIAAAMAIAVLTVAQIPQVSSYADSVMKTFTNIFYRGSSEVKQEGNYYDLDYAWEKERKFDSLVFRDITSFVTLCGWGTTLIVPWEFFYLKLKLLNLTGIAGGYLFLALTHSEPPLKHQ